MVAHKVTVLHHSGAVRGPQEDGHLHRVRLVPHIQQDHVKIEGGVRGNEARCGEAAKAKFTEVASPGGGVRGALHHLLYQLPSFLGKL